MHQRATLTGQVFSSNKLNPQGPHSHILMTGGGSDFFGSEILAKGDIFGSMKDAGIFLGREKITEGLFGVAKKEMRDFFGCVKKVVIFLGRQILKLPIFWGIKYEPLSDPPVGPPWGSVDDPDLLPLTLKTGKYV